VIEAEFDIPKLEASLKKAMAAFGDTNKQAVTRWAVQVGRELAVSTQVYGKTRTRQKQQWAIENDARNVIFPVDSMRPSKTGKTVRAKFQGKSSNWPKSRVLNNESEVNDWIEMNRTRRRARTAKIPLSEAAICTLAVFNKAMKTRFARAGMAKGGWLGASNQAAGMQTGAQRMPIGKNFLSYAQKHGKSGSATLQRGDGFKPIAALHNKVSYSSSPHVLSKAEISKSIGFGLRKTINWYRSAARKALDK
jgi:hypothetical protein